MRFTCCQQRALTEFSPEFNAIRSALSLHSELGADRMKEGPIRLFGFATRREIEGIIGKTENPSGPFAGNRWRWQHSLVIPYYSAPGRICGFGFAQSPQRSGCFAFHRRDYGLAGADPAQEGGSPIIVGMQDPLSMLRWRMRHFRTGPTPLPVVAWRADVPGRTRHAWSMLRHKQIVLWAFGGVTLDLLVQCRETDAKLAICGPNDLDRQTICSCFKNTVPTDILRLICRTARPWRQAVRAWLRKIGEIETVGFLNRLSQVDAQLAIEVGRMSETHGAERLSIKRIRLDRAYVERNGQWFVERRARAGDNLLFDGVVRIEQIVKRPTTIECRGRIHSKNQVVSFLTTDDKPLNTIVRNALLRANILTEVPDKLPLRATASQFSPPEILEGRERVGWDGAAFAFRHFSIADGKRIDHSECVFGADETAPEISMFQLGCTMVERAVTPGVETEVAWALITSLLTSNMAPACVWDALLALVARDGGVFVLGCVPESRRRF